MISKCKCKHDGQDKLHGQGNRVFNRTAKAITKEVYEHRCTVCGAVHKLKV